MMNFITIILFYLFVSLASSEFPEEIRDQDAANLYTEEIIEKTTKSLIDVLELPDYNMTIAYRPLFRVITAVCHLKEGQATGMQSLQRHRDAEIKYRKRDMLVKLPAKFQNFTVKYKMILNIWMTTFNVTLETNILTSDIVTTVKMIRNSNVVSLEDVSVRYFTGVKIRVPELGYYFWPADTFAARFGQFLNYKVAAIVEKHLKNVMEAIVASTLYPSVWT